MAMRTSSVLIVLVLARSCTTHHDVNAMVIPRDPHSSPCTRRHFIPAAASASGAISSLFLGSNTLQRDARAADGATTPPPPPPTRPQPIPIPIAGIGGAAPLRPVVFERTENPWKTPSFATKLGTDRIGVPELSPLGPSLSPFGDKDVFYPTSFLGEWNINVTLCRKSYPYGVAFVPSLSLIEGSPRYRREMVGESTSYRARYYSLDDDGTGTSSTKIIADRRFNSIAATRAYDQLTPVQDILWDPRKDPTLLKIQFAAGGLTKDMMPIGPRRAEVYITARKKEDGVGDGNGSSVFAASERTRQVTLGAGSVDVFDTESVTEYELMSDGNTIRAVQRIAVYLTPNPNSKEGVLWQQVGGKAVAFFDYVIEMQKA